MSELIEMLQEKVKKAVTALSKSYAKYQAAEKEHDQARHNYSIWVMALKREADEAGIKIDAEMLVSPLEEQAIALKKSKRVGPTIPDLAEESIKEKGPLNSKELQQILNEKGKKTTVNTVSVSLNRQRPERFDRNGDGKWFLVTQEGSDLEEIQAASE